MESRSVDFSALFRASWFFFKNHLEFVIGIVVTYLVVAHLPGFLLDFYYEADGDIKNFDVSKMLFSSREMTTKEVFFSVMIQLLKWITEIGIVAVFLRLVDGQPTSVSDLFRQWPKVFAYVVATIIYSLSILVGIILLVVPGIYLGIRLQFYAYLILDKDLNPFEALSESYHMTDRMSLDLFLLAVSLFFLIIGGFLALFIGIIPVLGFIFMLQAILYRSISEPEQPIPANRYQNVENA